MHLYRWLTAAIQSRRCQVNDWCYHKYDCRWVATETIVPRQPGHSTLEYMWGTLAKLPDAFALLAVIAGMQNLDPATQYLFWDIFVEMPKKRSSLRGLTCRVDIEEK